MLLEHVSKHKRLKRGCEKALTILQRVESMNTSANARQQFSISIHISLLHNHLSHYKDIK